MFVPDQLGQQPDSRPEAASRRRIAAVSHKNSEYRMTRERSPWYNTRRAMGDEQRDRLVSNVARGVKGG